MQSKFDITRFLTPSDILPIFVVIAGLLVAIFLEDTAVRLIGFCVTVLGLVALFMLISQRLTTIVDSKFKPKNPPPNFKITVKKDTSATRQVIEDFDSTFEVDLSKAEVKPAPIQEFVIGEEGFRVIKKDKAISNKTPQSASITANSEKLEKAEIVENVIANELDDSITFEKRNVEDKAIFDQENFKTIAEEKSTNDIKQEIITFEDFDNEIEILHKTEEEIESMPKVELVAQSLSQSDKEEAKIPNLQIPISQEDNSQEPLYTLLDDEDIPNNEPRKEFEFFVSRILMAVRSVSNTVTASFFLFDRPNNRYILDSYASDVPSKLLEKGKFDLSSDVISQIIKTAKPEILSEINPNAERQLLPYYKINASTRSFIGIPVAFNGQVAGVLTADSSEPDSYDSLSVSFLGHFAKLISGLLQSYAEKYDLIQVADALEIINKFQDFASKTNNDIDELSNFLCQSIQSVVEANNIGVVAYHENSEKWKIIATNNAELEDSSISIDMNSAVGRAIEKGEPSFIHPISLDDNLISGSTLVNAEDFFFTMPISSSSGIFGAIFVQGSSNIIPVESDIRLTQMLVNHAAIAMEKLYFTDLLRSQSLREPEFGMYNPSAFNSLLEIEISRSKDLSLPLSLAIIKIDKYSSFDPTIYAERFRAAVEHVISNTKKHLRVYDYLGKLDEDIFVVLLSGFNQESSRLWCEKTRNEIATKLIETQGKKFNVTVSVGLVSSDLDDTTSEQLLQNAYQALLISLEKTNCVSIFS